MSQIWPGYDPVAYTTPMQRIGRSGCMLARSIDQLTPTELSRLVNMRSLYGRYLEVRPGETALGTTNAGDNVHSLYRLNDPANSAFARLAGSNTALYRGTTGAFSSVDTGYSGNPLTFCGVTLPLTGLPFVFVGDASKMRKIDRTNAIQTIGLGNGVLTSTALGTQLNISVCQFQSSDSTQAANWTMTAGKDTSGASAGAPTAADTGPVGDKSVAFTTSPTGAGSGLGYYSVVSIAKSMDLSNFPGPVAVTDDDYIAFDVLIDPPTASHVLSYDVWLVVGAFTAGVIPGSSTTQNTDAYGVTISSPDLLPIMYWATVGFPLRRGQFTRVGTDGTATWATVTGIVIVLRTSSNLAVTLTFNGMYVEGGSNPDVGDPTFTPYDYRVRNFNPSTGTKGNPSAIQATSAALSSLRQPNTVQPTATGTAALRQQIFRRGGSPASSANWFYVGVNTSDGGSFSDTASDETALAGEVLEIDNDQPVTSVDSSGNTVLNQIVPVFFMVEDFCFALGDLLQPQRLYRSKQGAPENWPATSYVDPCPASDELMNGGKIGSAGFVFSRTRMYSILLNADGTFTTEPTECAEGLVGRWALCETPYGIAFVSPFGVRITTGGIPEPISDAQIGPLFRGETVNGFNPIDLTVPTALKLAYADNDLWLTYQDSGGARRQWIYNFLDKTWRSYLFGTQVSCMYNEPIQGGAASLLLGSVSAGGVYTHSGFSDLGSAISYTARTGAWDFGDPAIEKLLSQIRLHGNLLTDVVTVQAFLNNEATAVTAQTVTGTASSEQTYNLEPFGTTPLRARNVSVEIRGTASTAARPWFNLLGVSNQTQPLIVFNEATPWEELPGGEGYLYGCILTCDTAGVSRSVVVEYTTNNGGIVTAATLTVIATGRVKLPFSWDAVYAQQVRIRPTGNCAEWIRYKLEWLSDPEPPRIPGWNTNWDDFGSMSDKWIKGYLIEADTFGIAKTVVLDIDGALAQDSRSLTFSGPGIQHIAFAKLKGRLFRLRATDSQYGKFYRWQPIFDEEPLALTRWETEELTHGIRGWSKPLEIWTTLRSTTAVSLVITAFNASGTQLDQSTYTLPTTAGAKICQRVLLNPTKGVLYTYVFTAASPFTLYREESAVYVEGWTTAQAGWAELFGNDDLSPVPPRAMGAAGLSAAALLSSLGGERPK